MGAQLARDCSPGNWTSERGLGSPFRGEPAVVPALRDYVSAVYVIKFSLSGLSPMDRDVRDTHSRDLWVGNRDRLGFFF